MILNVNVGVLGHVDSGKTSLAKALSTVASTAAFDKNPQSKERGITLDLGFSSFKIPAPPALTGVCSEVQYTLVDCPGHASLIRTIIGGAQIIDLMLLVIDVTKGIQTQTAECLILGEITADKMILVLNKIDTLPQEKRASSIEKVIKAPLERDKVPGAVRVHPVPPFQLKKNLRGKVLSKTRFKDAPIIEVAAKNGDEGDPPIGLDHLIDQLKALTSVPERNPLGPFLFSVDHCFSIRGQGTVMTGTVLQGSVAINDVS